MDSPEEQAGTTAPQGNTVSANGGVPEMVETHAETLPVPVSSGGRRTPPPSSSGGDDGGGGDEEDGMLRMSFLEHLEELRSRLIRMVMGIGVAFAVSLTFTDRLWNFVCQPAVTALKTLGYEPTLVQIAPMESFNIIWM